MLIHILSTALPVFAALFIGVLCRKKNIFSRTGIDAFKRLAVDITLPAVLFQAFASADYTLKTLIIPILMFLLCAAALGLGFLSGKLFRRKSRLMPFLMTGFEAGMIGYGLFALLFPNESNSSFAIVDLGQCLFVFSVYKGLLMGRDGKKELARQALASPVMLAILAGLLVGATGLYKALEPSGITGIIDKLSSFISAPTSCLILVAIGFDLQLRRVSWQKALTYIGTRMLILGILLAVMLFVNRCLLGRMIHEGALILMMILPAPYVLPIFADAEDERTDIASTLSIMTLLSLILFSVMAAAVA